MKISLQSGVNSAVQHPGGLCLRTSPCTLSASGVLGEDVCSADLWLEGSATQLSGLEWKLVGEVYGNPKLMGGQML